jgi:hypothetical protein
MVMSIPLLSTRGAGTQEMYAHALRSVYHGYRVYDVDYALAKDPDIYEKVRRDPVIAKAIDMRLHGVAGRNWRCVPGGEDPASKLVAKMCEEALKGIRRFGETRYELASAIIRGLSFGYIEGERKLDSLAETAPMEWWLPKRIQDVDRRRFRRVPIWTGEGRARKLRVEWQMFSVESGDWLALEHPEYFIKVTYNDEEARLGYGRGLLEAMYFYHWIKGEILKEGLHGIKKWARGNTIAKIDGLTPGSAAEGSGSDDRTNDAVKQAFIDALKRQEEEHILVVAKGDEVEHHETSGTGHQLVMETIAYLDGALVSLILGSQLPFGGAEGVGSNARAETELDVHESLIQFDRDKIDEDITNDLIGLWCTLNATNFRELGLGGARMPKFQTVQEKRKDTQKNAAVIQTANAAGIDLRRDEVYEKIEFTPPQEGDEVIAGRQAAPSPFGGSPFDAAEFDRAMPNADAAKLARALIRLGTKPEDAVRCAVETLKTNGRDEAPPPAPPAQAPITINSPVTVQAAAPAPQGNINLHLPESIKLEALNPRQPDVVVNVPKPDPVVVNVHPTPVTVAAPKVEVQVAAPNVTVEAPRVDVKVEPKILAEVKLLDSLPFKLELPPVKKTVEFTKGKDGGITGAEIKTEAA